MESKSENFDNILRILDRIGTIVGLRIIEHHNQSLWQSRGKVIYRWFVTIFMASFSFCMYGYWAANWNNIFLLIQSIVILFILLNAFNKIFYFNYHRTKLLNILAYIKYFRETNIKTEKEREIQKMYTKRMLLISRFFVLLYLSAGVMNFVIPLVLRQHILPLPAQLPFVPPMEYPFYEINWIYPFIASSLLIIVIGTVDGVFVTLLGEGCFQVDIIEEKLSHVGETNVERNKDFAILRDIYFMHMGTNRFFNEIDGVFSWMLVVQMALSTYGLACGIVAIADSVSDNFGIFVIIFAYCVQIFIFTWIGEQVKSKMSNMVNSFYNSHWCNLDLSCRRCLVIMMSCSQPSFEIRAGGLVELTLSTFIAILKTAYSYYAVMQNN